MYRLINRLHEKAVLHTVYRHGKYTDDQPRWYERAIIALLWKLLVLLSAKLN